MTVQKDRAIDILRFYKGRNDHPRVGVQQIQKKRFRVLF